MVLLQQRKADERIRGMSTRQKREKENPTSAKRRHVRPTRDLSRSGQPTLAVALHGHAERYSNVVNAGVHVCFKVCGLSA